MDFCNHDSVTIEAGEYGSPRVVDAPPVAAFSRELLNSASWDVFAVEGDRIIACGNVVYEVTDWHHRCPGRRDAEMVLARLVSRPPQSGDVEMLLIDALITGVSALVITPRPEEADA